MAGFENISRLYREIEGKPFVILQFWQSRNCWNSGILAQWYAAYTHWVLYTGISRGNLELTEDEKLRFPVEKYGLAMATTYFYIDHCFKVKPGPMIAMEREEFGEDDSRVHYPAGLFDWSLSMLNLEHFPRELAEKRKCTISGLAKDRGRMNEECYLYNFMAFGQEAAEHLIHSRSFYVAHCDGFFPQVADKDTDNMQWAMRESLKAIQPP